MSTLLHKDRLEGVNPLLSHCLVQAIESWDDPAVWTVSDGLRSLSQQQGSFVMVALAQCIRSIWRVAPLTFIASFTMVALSTCSYGRMRCSTFEVLREWSGVRVAGRSIVWGGLWKLADYGHFELH